MLTSLRFTLPLTLVVALPACDSAESTCVPGVASPGCPVAVGVRASTVGHTTTAGKRATYVGPESPFEIRSTADDSVVFQGTAGPEVTAQDTDEKVRIIDFTDLQAPGEYYVQVLSVGKSSPFVIADDVFVEPFYGAMLGMYGLRCGTAVNFSWQGTRFGHGECHLADVAHGGWHDAGDYGKYTTNGSFSLAMMLFAWEHFRDKLEPIELPIPEQGGALPDYLDECKYQTDWLLAMQDQDSGGVYDRLTPYCASCGADNQPFDPLNMMPEGSTNDRRLAPISTPATADFAAVLARSARVFEPYDAEYAATLTDAAMRAWQYLVENPQPQPPTNINYTGYYLTGDPDDRFWAAAEIFETTGDEGALAEFEMRAPMMSFPPNWDWADVQNLGLLTYLSSTREGRNEDRVAELTTAMFIQADTMKANADRHAYGRSLDRIYYWGINGVIARTAMTLELAARMSDDDSYRVTSAYQLDHLFGRNYYARSFVTGMGANPPENPHHRPSIGDGVVAPWPGLLIGGPSDRSTPLTATTWKDESGDYESNEVAINWNAALVYILAAHLP